MLGWIGMSLSGPCLFALISTVASSGLMSWGLRRRASPILMPVTASNAMMVAIVVWTSTWAKAGRQAAISASSSSWE